MATVDAAQPGLSRKDRIFNFSICFFDAIGWPLGMAFFNGATIIPVILQHLGASNAVIGALPALTNILTFMPGFLVAGYIGRMRRVRAYLFWMALIERLFLLPLVPLTVMWGPTHPAWLVAAIFLCFSVNTLIMGLNQPSYWVFVAKVIATTWRGRLFGFAGGIAGILGIAVERLMAHLASGPDGGFPGGYSAGFLIGCIILIVTFAPIGIAREPDGMPRGEDDAHSGHYGRDSLRIWREDTNFRRFLWAQIFWTLSGVAAPFYVLYARETFHVSAGVVALYTGILVVAPAFGSLGWGAWADKKGNKIVLIAAMICVAAAPLWALLAPTANAYYAVFILTAMGMAGVFISGANVIMEYAGHSRDVPLYIAFYNLVTTLPRAAAPLLGGFISDNIGSGYRVTFVLSTLCACASLFLTLRLVEPRDVEQVHDGAVGHHGL